MSRKQKLLHTSLRLFNQFGYHATGVDLIIKESGVSKATLYKYFRTKEELILAALHIHHERFMEVLKKHIEKAKTSDIKTNEVNENNHPILGIFDIYTRWFQQEDFYGCQFVKASSEYTDVNSKINQYVSYYKQSLYNLLSEHLNDGKLAKEEYTLKAEAIVLLLDGSIIDAQLRGNKEAAVTAKTIAREILKN